MSLRETTHGSSCHAPHRIEVEDRNVFVVKCDDPPDDEFIVIWPLSILAFHDHVLTPAVESSEQRMDVVERHVVGNPNPVDEAFEPETSFPRTVRAVLTGRV